MYILRAISTSDIFSTSSVKACTSSNDIPSCGGDRREGGILVYNYTAAFWLDVQQKGAPVATTRHHKGGFKGNVECSSI